MADPKTDYQNIPEFMRLFSSASKDLEKVTKDIAEEMKLYTLRRELEQGFFAKDENGKPKFFLHDPKNWAVNLLERFPTPEALADYVASIEDQWHPHFSDPETKKHIPENYEGPKIRLLKDTNIKLDPAADSYIAMLSRHPYIVSDTFTIVNRETMRGGLKSVFDEDIPNILSRGQVSLEKRCKSLKPEVKSELTMIYDIFQSLFKKEVEDIMDYAKANASQKTTREIAWNFVRAKRPEFSRNYANTVRKMIEKCRKGRECNFIADNVLTAAAFCFNLVENRDKAVVVSNDGDMINIFDFFYEKVIPTYMAKTTIAAMKERNPTYLQIPGCERKTINAARRQIEWAKSISPEENLAVGILYVPRDKAVYVKQVASQLKEYFQKVELYRHGKIDLISRMVITGKNAEETVQELMREETMTLIERTDYARDR